MNMNEEKEIIVDDNLEEESKFKRVIKRIFLMIIALLLLILVLSYLLPSSRILSSQFNSYEINQDTIILKSNNKIVFDEGVYQELLGIYNNNQQHEFKVCLMGDKGNNVYRVDSIEIPRVISQDFSSVRAEPCGDGTIIALHSHPFKSCYFSVHDINSFRLTRNIDENTIIGIMCEPERFNFYGFD